MVIGKRLRDKRGWNHKYNGAVGQVAKNTDIKCFIEIRKLLETIEGGNAYFPFIDHWIARLGRYRVKKEKEILDALDRADDTKQAVYDVLDRIHWSTAQELLEKLQGILPEYFLYKQTIERALGQLRREGRVETKKVYKNDGRNSKMYYRKRDMVKL